MSQNTGIITQIIGPVIDISFSSAKLPKIYNSLIVETSDETGNKMTVTCEVQLCIFIILVFS